MMQFRYDEEIDAVYLFLNNSEIGQSEVTRSEEVLPGVISDFDESNNILGIEILYVRSRTSEQLYSQLPV
jgi:uncharacterized protein YuzE